MINRAVVMEFAAMTTAVLAASCLLIAAELHAWQPIVSAVLFGSSSIVFKLELAR